ncbi:MAG TPA: STAS domain-containing protein [Spirochaetota bacterium]|nr:STAS domain-containing protein [Spirochaetota bacterium]HPJ37447.1 STAS domain-containing protein [Spirochaetota bacterium]HPQ52004.1 STAS domain-containing protein [Spirochaetota bacterium]
MQITTKHPSEDTVIITLDGRFDIEEVITFESSCSEFLKSGFKNICLDLSELKYIDSSGIGSLIKTMNITKNENAGLFLLDVQPDIMKIFKLAYLDKFFTITTKKEFLKKD